MAEAEGVITEVVRHLWAWVQGARADTPAGRGERAPGLMALRDHEPMLRTLLQGAFGRQWALRPAQEGRVASPLSRAWRGDRRISAPREPLPSCDAHHIWLPLSWPDGWRPGGLHPYALMALCMAQRSVLRGPQACARGDLALVVEADQADLALLAAFPGLQDAVLAWRAARVSQRPALQALPRWQQEGERWLRAMLAGPIGCVSAQAAHAPATLAEAWLWKDAWTGDWPRVDAEPGEARKLALDADVKGSAPRAERTAHLNRRPTVRQAQQDEDDAQPGAWMVQNGEVHELAQDPFGLNRPVDQHDLPATEGLAEDLEGLHEARLVRTPSRAAEVLLSADPPRLLHTAQKMERTDPSRMGFHEWDGRTSRYVHDAVSISVSRALEAPAEETEKALGRLRVTLRAVRQQFEWLKNQPKPLRRQRDGHDIDLDACLEARVDWRAARWDDRQGLYQSLRLQQRDSAMVILADISGSTDAWVDADRRIIDIEREALLVLSVALDACAQPHALLAFSGHGPHGVAVSEVKRFDEVHDAKIARRITALEPQQFTRVGAALRFASHYLALQPARQPIVLLLSDGKPHDCDHYEGRYGVEDMRQAVREARAQGQMVFCITVDRHAPPYLSRAFGARHFAVLRRPQDLPSVLLQCVRGMLA